MCTPWAFRRLMRWRVGEWTSNAFDPSDEEPAGMAYSFPPQLSTQTKRYKPKNKIKYKKQFVSSTEVVRNEAPEIESDSQSSHFRDEDYIVFYFKGDGDVQIIKKEVEEEKSEAYSIRKCSISPYRAINRKLNYGETAGFVHKQIRESNVSEKDGESDPESPKEFTTRSIGEGQYEENEEFGTGSTTNTTSIESSTSTKSHSSTSSFAFPELVWERSGSPERMPEPEGVYDRKHRARLVGFQCCKF